MRSLHFYLSGLEVALRKTPENLRALPRRILNRFNKFAVENGESAAAVLNTYFCVAEMVNKGFSFGVSIWLFSTLMAWLGVPKVMSILRQPGNAEKLQKLIPDFLGYKIPRISEKDDPKEIQDHIGSAVSVLYTIGSTIYFIESQQKGDMAGTIVGFMGMGGNGLSIALRTFLDPKKHWILNIASGSLRALTCVPYLIDGFTNEPSYFSENLPKAWAHIRDAVYQPLSSGAATSFLNATKEVFCHRIPYGFAGGVAPAISNARLVINVDPPKNQLA